jgi:hypothetical protein
MKATGIARCIDDPGRVVIPGGDTPDDADQGEHGRYITIELCGECPRIFHSLQRQN